MNPRYMIGSGFYNPPGGDHDKFFSVWFENTVKYAQPEDILILSNGGSVIEGAQGQWIDLPGNLGHTHDLTNGRKPYEWCGWSMAFFTLAMLSYCNETDFIFKEEDCLAFGPWVQQMYAEIGDKKCIFGSSKMPHQQACAQSLVLVKHHFIPEFVRLYMGTGSERLKENECELKFARLERNHPDHFTRFCFGYDRDRPINYGDAVWYGQHFTPQEMHELRRLALI